MARKIWDVTLDGKDHKVELNHNYLTSKRVIMVDEKEIQIDKPMQVFDYGSNHKFKIGAHDLEIIISIASFGIVFNYDLLVDGVSQKSGKKLTEEERAKKLNIYTAKIESEEHASNIIKQTGIAVSIITIGSAAIHSVLGDYWAWIDAFVITLLSVWLIKKKSRAAAIIMLVIMVGSLMVTIANNLGIGGGIGSNILLSIFMAYLTIRTVQATNWIKKNTKN